MTNISLDLSNKLPIQTVEVLRLIENCASRLDIPILLVGATAREFVLQHMYKIRGRATRDIDFAVCVNNLGSYDNLKDQLISGLKFKTDTKNYRLIEIQTQTPIDFIPFGKIESPQGKVKLGIDHEMTTIGFNEALHSAWKIKLAKDLEIKVVSPAGLALLKIIAWTERHSNRDSQDFWLVAKNYWDLGNEERIYSEHNDLLLDEDFDYIVAGARLLGRDLSQLLTKDSEKLLLSVFEDEKTLQKLAIELHRIEGKVDESLDPIISVLSSVRRGIRD